MSTSHFRLTEDLVVDDLMHWYHAAVVGDVAVIPLPAHTCCVRPSVVSTSRSAGGPTRDVW